MAKMPITDPDSSQAFVEFKLCHSFSSHYPQPETIIPEETQLRHFQRNDIIKFCLALLSQTSMHR